ncbi:MAG: Flp pilus assembly protein CpaB [Acidimicrobiia bacterium]
MFGRSPRALLFWAAAALVAVWTASYAARELTAVQRREARLGRSRTVVVARRDLAIGATVRTGDLVTARVHDGYPPGALASPAPAVGRVVVVPVLRGETITIRHVAAASRHGLAAVVPRGMRAVRIVVADGLRPRPGQSVDVLATFDPAKVPDAADATVTVVAAAPVVRVDRAGGGGSAPASAGPGIAGAGDPAGVTLLVDAEHARRLAYARVNAVLTLALVPPEETAYDRSARGRGGDTP